METPDITELDSNPVLEVHDKEKLTLDLYNEEIPSIGDVRTAQEQFTRDFAQRFSSLGLPFYCGPLDEAIASMINPASRPLILYIHNDRSIAINIFCEQVLCTDEIPSYLAENFTVWPWDRTSDMNYNRLLLMLNEYVGGKIKDVISSCAIDDYPLLCCLVWNEGQIEIVDMIKGMTSKDDTHKRLMQARSFSDGCTMSPSVVNDRIRWDT